MAGVNEKLYPPVINGSLPAFYEENGTARIVVPFSMNRAVNIGDIGGFRLRIKTVQSNTEITTLSNSSSPSTAIADEKVIFEWSGFDAEHRNTQESRKIRVGQYLKVQLAYVSDQGIVGYFSTVGIIKYTSKPNVYISGLSDVHGSTSRSNYIGVFELSEDKSERPYYYSFSLFNNLGKPVETSGWLLHNTSIDNVATEALSLDATTDNYSFNTALNTNEEYWIQYSVRTINNLEVSSTLYNIAEVDTGPSLLNVNLYAENYFDDGFIELRFTDAREDSTELSEPVSLEILRAEKTDNYLSWRLITELYVSNYVYAIGHQGENDGWYFRDFTVEQGVTYKYCFREYNAAGVQSNRTFSNAVFCDFEDAFLFDGEKQLKIRFNPKVSSFKTTRLENKTDTIGSRYPFIFRNGVVGYKEFPIAGLISYKMDDNELFIHHKDDIDILLSDYAERLGNPVDQTEDDTDKGKSWEISETFNSTGYNMRAERRFKLKVMDWLGDGKVKLFRSPAEGNYLVRLMNISLSPEDKLGRMIHNFSANAYEVEECTYNNLVKLGFFNTQQTTTSGYGYKTIKLVDAIPSQYDGTSTFKINDEPIVGYVRLELSSGGPNGGTPFYVRVGDNDVLVVAPGYFLGTEGNTNISYPDFYYVPSLNNTNTAAGIQALVEDAQLTYMYEQKAVTIGSFNNIKDAYLSTVVRTISPNTDSGQNGWFSFGLSDFSNISDKQESIVKFYSLNFRQIGNNNNETGTEIKLRFSDGGEDVELDQEPVLDLAEINQQLNRGLVSIYLGDNMEVDCAYQLKTIEKEGGS